MSHQVLGKTQFTDQEVLVRALVGMGFTEEQIEIHEQPVPVTNYYGKKDALRAHVLIRRRHAVKSVGQADIGWVREADGTFSMIVDDMMDTLGGGYGAEWQRQLKQQYTVKKSCKHLEGQGLRPEITQNERGHYLVRAKLPQATVGAGLRGG